MRLIEIPTGSLDGNSLDWALAVIDDKNPEIDLQHQCITAHLPTVTHPQMRALYKPSTIWRQAGPLIDSYDVWFSSKAERHLASCHPHTNQMQHYGPTKLVAAGRAIIQKRCGDTIWVPAILIGPDQI